MVHLELASSMCLPAICIRDRLPEDEAGLPHPGQRRRSAASRSRGFCNRVGENDSLLDHLRPVGALPRVRLIGVRGPLPDEDAL